MFFVSDEVSQFACYLTGAIVWQQPWLVKHMQMIAAAAEGLQCQFQRVGNTLSPHRRAQLPRNNVARVSFTTASAEAFEYFTKPIYLLNADGGQLTPL